MKKSMLSGLFILSAVLPAAAQTVEFRGAACITSVTAACSAAGWSAGDCLLLRYSPPMLGSNGAATEFTLVGQSYADNYSLATGSLVGATNKAVVGLHVGRTGFAFNSTMRIQSQQPSPLLSTSKSVSFTANVTNFDDTASCSVNLRASAANRP